MNIWSKMMTALRGGLNEAGESIVDSQAIRILDQEIRDAANELKQSKDSLTEIMARQKVTEEKCAQLKKQIEEHEGYALKALDMGDEALAREVAEKVADLENQLDHESSASEQFKSSADALRLAIKQAEQNLKRIKQQVDTVKATENVQRAQVAVAERHSGSQSRMRTAMDSLERIKEKQSLKAAHIASAKEVAEESGESSLKSRLQEAGIVPASKSADDILARLKKK